MKCLGFSAQLRPPSAANQKSLIWNRFWASFDTAFSRIGQDISETFRPVHLNLWYRWFIGEFSEQNIQMILGQIDWSYSHVRERKSVGGRALKIPGSYIDMLEDLVFKACLNNFEKFAEYRTNGLYFEALLTLNNAKIRKQWDFRPFRTHVFTALTRHLFLSSLELLLKCVWYGPPGPLGPKILGQWGQMCSRHILKTMRLNIMIWKSYESPLALDVHWLCHFLQEAQGGEVVGSDIYRQSPAGLIFVLTISKGHMMTFNNRSLLPALLT